MKLKNNIEIIKKEIDENKKFQEINLIAVTKFIDIEVINDAISLGIKNVAENRVQEIQKKYDLVNKGVSWHQIGTLQKNKVKYIIDKVDLIHSLDSFNLACEIEKQSNKIAKRQECLLQIKISEEESKKGIDEDNVMFEFDKISNNCKNIDIVGVMGMAPYFEKVENTRGYFSRLKIIYDKLNEEFGNLKYLSMGMSNDYKIALQEGSNMIRIGSALFDGYYK